MIKSTRNLQAISSHARGMNGAALQRFGVNVQSARPECFMSESGTPTDPNSESFLPQSTVLIVDDNPQNVELLAAFLESLPVRIFTASDGIEALRKVQEHNPDLILLDVM